eukprot:68191-Pelagomonas_calceolata.AAC.4
MLLLEGSLLNVEYDLTSYCFPDGRESEGRLVVPSPKSYLNRARSHLMASQRFRRGVKCGCASWAQRWTRAILLESCCHCPSIQVPVAHAVRRTGTAACLRITQRLTFFRKGLTASHLNKLIAQAFVSSKLPCKFAPPHGSTMLSAADS